MAENSIVLCLAKTKRGSAGYIVFGYPVRHMGNGVPWIPLERGAGYVNNLSGSVPMITKNGTVLTAYICVLFSGLCWF